MRFPMKNLFATAGFAVFMLWMLGALHVGHFRLIYGPDPITCTSDFPQNPLNPPRK